MIFTVVQLVMEMEQLRVQGVNNVKEKGLYKYLLNSQ